MANSVDPDQTALIGAVFSGSTLFASILNLSVMLGNYLQKTTSADNIFRCIFSGSLRVKLKIVFYYKLLATVLTTWEQFEQFKESAGQIQDVRQRSIINAHL